MHLTREDWVKAGLNKLIESGIHAVRVETLAQDLAISKGSFYHHFQNRRELLNAMADHWEDASTKRLIHQMEQQQFELEDFFLFIFTSDKMLDSAIYAWFRHDAALQTRITGIEKQRIDYLASLYRRKGMEGTDAVNRARLIYLAYLGWIIRYEGKADFDIKAVFFDLLEK
jgi:AcrR family transcriptional regulator